MFVGQERLVQLYHHVARRVGQNKSLKSTAMFKNLLGDVKIRGEILAGAESFSKIWPNWEKDPMPTFGNKHVKK